MIINANTKIASLLKENEAALEAIISITPKFEKLRNPLLRKLMAGRTSIAMASKISGCGIEAFFEKLKPLGFEVDNVPAPPKETGQRMPPFVRSLTTRQMDVLDVRPIIEAGEDPLSLIIKKVKAVEPGHALKIINSFEPTPLLSLLKKQGFEYYVDAVEANLVETYFYRPGSQEVSLDTTGEGSEDWEGCLEKFKGRLETVDVRHLPMPQPMMTILDALGHLPPGRALFVYHKKIPLFLLPELKEKGFDFRVKEIGDGQVHLLIFKE